LGSRWLWQRNSDSGVVPLSVAKDAKYKDAVIASDEDAACTPPLDLVRLFEDGTRGDL
jgi:hypothetical protein